MSDDTTRTLREVCVAAGAEHRTEEVRAAVWWAPRDDQAEAAWETIRLYNARCPSGLTLEKAGEIVRWRREHDSGDNHRG